MILQASAYGYDMSAMLIPWSSLELLADGIYWSENPYSICADEYIRCTSFKVYLMAEYWQYHIKILYLCGWLPCMYTMVHAKPFILLGACSRPLGGSYAPEYTNERIY